MRKFLLAAAMLALSPALAHAQPAPGRADAHVRAEHRDVVQARQHLRAERREARAERRDVHAARHHLRAERRELHRARMARAHERHEWRMEHRHHHR